MAYPLDESFDAGIPAGFASNGGAGGITATWNAGAHAVDLVLTQASLPAGTWLLTVDDGTDGVGRSFTLDVSLQAP